MIEEIKEFNENNKELCKIIKLSGKYAVHIKEQKYLSDVETYRLAFPLIKAARIVKDANRD